MEKAGFEPTSGPDLGASLPLSLILYIQRLYHHFSSATNWIRTSIQVRPAFAPLLLLPIIG